MIQSIKKISSIIVLYFLIGFSFGVQQISAHGVQMGYGILPNGFIRVYIEHWHGDNPGLSSSPLQIKVTIGATSFTQVYAATGVVANTGWNNLPGLGSNIIILSQCEHIANTYKDWAYYDFAPPACNIPITLEILQGTTVVTTEACGNLYPQTINATFTDNAGPAPDVANLPVITGECGVTLSAPRATDNCSGPVIGTSNNPLTYTQQGTYTVTWTYTDDHGFITQQTQTVIVKDVTAPVPNVAVLPAVSSECSATVTTVPTATDNCAGQIVGTTNDPLSYTANGSYTITWSFNDGHGNVSQQTQSINVINLAPVPDVANLPVVTDDCSVTLIAPTATDACSGTITGTTNDPLVYSAQGTFAVTWTFSDGSNSVQQTQVVEVKDVTAPVPDVVELPNVNGECSASVVAVPTATDACAGSVVGTTSDDLIYTSQGTYTITWTYSDGHGNSSQQTQTVVVQDVTPPVITASTGLLTLWSPNHKYESIKLSDFGLSASDNCANVSTATLVITKVTSDEVEDANGNGDGNTLNDIVIAGDYKSVGLRKEREGTSNGRVYTIHVSVSDGHGNVGNASLKVQVPHDKNDTAIDDGPAYEVFGGTVVPVSASVTNFAAARIEKINEKSASDAVVNKYIPEKIELNQNYPNPFNPTTTIRVAIPDAGYYTLKIYNTLGQEVAELVNGQLATGNYGFNFDASKLTSGLYIYTIRGDNVNISKKMVLMK